MFSGTPFEITAYFAGSAKHLARFYKILIKFIVFENLVVV